MKEDGLKRSLTEKNVEKFLGKTALLSSIWFYLKNIHMILKAPVVFGFSVSSVSAPLQLFINFLMLLGILILYFCGCYYKVCSILVEN
jgi:hypothetical protein